MKASIAIDAINQFLHIGDKVAHFSGSEIKLRVINHVRTAGLSNGQAVIGTWKEVQFKNSKRWVKASRIVRIRNSNW